MHSKRKSVRKGATAVSSNSSAFSAWKPFQSGNPSIQFGCQLPGTTASTIGTSTNFVFSKSEALNPTSSSVSESTGSMASNFVFGAKNENSNQIPTAVSQSSDITFESASSFVFSKKTNNSDAVSQKPFTQSTIPAIPVLGNTPVQPSFDGSDKPASGVFTFGASSSYVFQFRAGSNNTVKNAMDPVCNINFLPDEVLVEIFKYLTHNELARVSRVNKRWNESAKSPVLWKKVKVKLSWLYGSQNEITSSFAKNFSPSITYMKLDFWLGIWKKKLNFKQHCVKLKEMCPHLHTLILHRALLSVNFSSFMSLCSKCLPNLTALIVNSCNFDDNRGDREYCDLFFEDNFREREYSGHAKIEILDLSNCVNVPRSSMYSISKMPCLKKLGLGLMCVTDDWFMNEDSKSFLHQLECLHLGYTNVSFGTVSILKKYAPNLTELFLCKAELHGDEFGNAVLPRLKTICIKYAYYVDGDGLASIIRSLPSLQNVYVNEDMANSYAEQTNVSELGIVKVSRYCNDHEKIEFLLD